MLDTNLPLFERYRAMFGLRNRAGPTPDGRPRSAQEVKEAVEALAEGFKDSSALFR
jgi:deoxyhypusine monooxygenase